MFTRSYSARSNKFAVLSLGLAVCVGLNVILDLLESSFQSHSSFYFSESFLFSSFWWLFVPLLLGQFYFSGRSHGKFSVILIAIIPALIHLLVYPVLILVISAFFYDHTFPYRQTFEYELTRYGFILLIVYPAALVLFRKNDADKPVDSIPITRMDDAPKKEFSRSTMVVADGGRRTVIEIKDILYVSASSPYVYIHHLKKRYLHNDTLRSMSARLDSETFVRIHKSTIVNIAAVRSFRSRGNGDYDVIISDGSELRVSRNFAAAFKGRVAAGNQGTAQ
ncbi:MAG: LytTR family transcriptional regulator [Acidobacteria bacterium]|nr:LytTR family transcriptional regulator [Acidobacteriota bacterium]